MYGNINLSDNMYIDNNGNVKSNIGPNGETGYYKNNQTGDMGFDLRLKVK